MFVHFLKLRLIKCQKHRLLAFVYLFIYFIYLYTTSSKDECDGTKRTIPVSYRLEIPTARPQLLQASCSYLPIPIFSREQGE